MNLNQLLAGMGRREEQACLGHHTRAPLYPHPGTTNSFLEYQRPSPYTSPFPAPAPPPNSAFNSPALHRDPGRENTPSASRSLFPQGYSAPSSQLGLEDIFQRLDGLSQNLPAPAPPSALAFPPAPLPSLLSSRGSTPLSWNPLGALSVTPLSSLTPSPTLHPAPARPLMEQCVEDYCSQEQELLRRHQELLQARRQEKELLQARRQEQELLEARRQEQELLAARRQQEQTAIRGIAKLQVSSPSPPPNTSWSQVVRSTSSCRLPLSSPPAAPLRVRPSPPSSPAPPAMGAGGLPDYHRGPKVDPRWPVQQQVFLGPIPMTISWDEIRNIFYTKVSRKELLHFYVQSKPVNEVVYGQVVFDKVSLANKILKEGPIKVRGQYITMTAMGEKMKQMKLEKKK